MAEHKFKLKKDGKTVGYSHINQYGQLMFRFPHDEDWWCISKFWSKMIERYKFGICPCTYHPFVTKDKNGKDVFADDEIKALTFWRGNCKEPQTITGKVGLRDETLSYVLYHTPNTPECIELWKLTDIELIENKNA